MAIAVPAAPSVGIDSVTDAMNCQLLASHFQDVSTTSTSLSALVRCGLPEDSPTPIQSHDAIPGSIAKANCAF